MSQIILHADDFGVCDEATDNIMECINYGTLNSASIICNTEGFSYAIKRYLYSEIPFRLCLHINLVEGKPISPMDKVAVLVNKDGEFKYSFISLWIKYLASGGSRRQLIRQAVKTEIESQLTRFLSVGPQLKIICIDSHTHTHMIPFILDTILEISENNNIDLIRIPYEIFYFTIEDIKHYFSLAL